MKTKIIEILNDNEKESPCGEYDYIWRIDYEKVAEEILSILSSKQTTIDYVFKE